jgi:arylsulfatase A-like enzyme
MIITDQERATQHFPPDWEQKHLPNMSLLKQNGLSFKNAVCNACMCSPSRSTLFTSLYPAQHGVTDTLSFGGRYSVTETDLDNTIPTIAKVLHRSHGSQYRGKWHMCKGGQNNVHPEKSLMAAEVAVFGFAGWTPPDSGEDTKLENFGGGYANHDANYIQQAIDFIENYKKEKKKAKAAGKTQKPFFLVVSLVNPHDVLSYPSTYEAGGYEDPKWLHGDIQLPATVNENLQTNYKPAAQQMNLQLMAASLGPLRVHPSPDGGAPVMDDQRLFAYINFYGNLLHHIDGEIGKLLDLFYNEADESGKRAPKALAKETLIIRTADHGEMGLAHGGLRQKAFNAYEETMRVPLVFSNPKIYPGGAQSDQLISLIDLLPTIAGYYGAKPPANIRGVDMSPVLRDPSLTDPIQDSTLFTFDDIRAGATNTKEPVNAADRVRCLRQSNWKYSRYFRTEGSYPEEYELYYLGGIHDPNYSPQTELEKYLLSQPYEYINLAYDDNPLMADWPPEIKSQIAQKRDELALALAQKEQLLLIS